MQCRHEMDHRRRDRHALRARVGGGGALLLGYGRHRLQLGQGIETTATLPAGRTPYEQPKQHRAEKCALRRRVEQFEDELDTTKIEMKEGLVNLTMKVNQLEMKVSRLDWP